MANEQDIIVYFHAPWCIHCKAIESVMTELATHYANDASFALYRIDGSKNEVHHEGVKVYAYPTIYFFPAQRYEQLLSGEVVVVKKPVKYDVEEGDGLGNVLSLESMLYFIMAYRHQIEQILPEDSTSNIPVIEEVEEESTAEENEQEASEANSNPLDQIVYEDEEVIEEQEGQSSNQVDEEPSVILEEL